jgi:arabinofuranosyltransferase
MSGLFLFPVGVFFTLYLLFGGSTLEDAHITFRYARHLATGAGLGIWNPGEPPVEGATSFIWMLVLGAGMSLGVSPFLLSKAIGAISCVGVLSLYFVASLHRPAPDAQDLPRDVPLIAAILTSFYVPLAWYAASGMETLFFAALVAFLLMSRWVVRRKTTRILADTLVGGLLVLTRPEGALLAPLVSSYNCVSERSRSWMDFLPIGSSLGVNGLAAVLRYAYFGDFLPNTYYAKASGNSFHLFHAGALYLVTFFACTLPVWVVIGLRLRAAWLEKKLAGVELFLVGAVALYSACMLKVGGDPESAFPFWRHFVHIAPIWMLLAAFAIHHVGETFKARIALALAVSIVTNLAITAKAWQIHIWPSIGLETEGQMSPYFAFVNRFADADTTSAVSMAGQWGWYVPGRMIDVLGLNDRHIAHFGRFQAYGPLDTKTDMPYVMARRPDIIDGFLSGKELNREECPRALSGGRSDMLRGMLEYPSFSDAYFFVASAPYDIVDRALFVSERIAASLRDGGITLVRARDTALFSAGCLRPGGAPDL